MNRPFSISLTLTGLVLLMFASPALAETPTKKKAAERPFPAINERDLFRHWVHSSEEEQVGTDVWVYRPAASRNFPPSRFRMAYKFMSNGRCEFYYLSPDDNHRFKPCLWKLAGKDKARLEIRADGQWEIFKITQLSRDVLRIKPLDLPSRK